MRFSARACGRGEAVHAREGVMKCLYRAGMLLAACGMRIKLRRCVSNSIGDGRNANIFLCGGLPRNEGLRVARQRTGIERPAVGTVRRLAVAAAWPASIAQLAWL